MTDHDLFDPTLSQVDRTRFLQWFYTLTSNKNVVGLKILGLKIVVFLRVVSAMCFTFPCLPPTNLYYLINSVDKSNNLVFHVPTDAAPQFL